ncbi:hypothetical protein BN12_900017 [Nostocoides japonicum T1-X7]|uniref:Uncharacterized protein n=2 Tax=Nostocoides japonicum TaxID=99481 RepID=A0A077M215_9MICO|nr:hypothetical protein BN12_900017 [Tetrasphaera japonica T1-X7]
MTGHQRDETALEAARAAAAGVRAVNHLTQPGAARLDAPALYDLMAELTLLARRLPQALHQVDASLQRLVPDDVVVVGGEFAGDPQGLAGEVHEQLSLAATNARQVADAADRAHQALSAAATPDHPVTAPQAWSPVPHRELPPLRPPLGHARGPAI